MSSPRTTGSGDRIRLDLALADRGLARSRSEAAGLISAGEIVLNGVVATKASLKCGPGDVVALRSDGPRYVSRAGHKLAGALELFADVVTAGRRCLDAGASTGGFTDVLLRSGAQQVVAVDVGHDQLVEALRADHRVEVHEGCNVRDLTPEHIGGAVDLVVSDLSFISLRLVMSPLAGVCRPGADLVVMVKPQFEVGRRALPKTGVVLDPEQRRGAVAAVLDTAVDAGLRPRGLARSPLPGQDGNVEFFLWLDHPGGTGAATAAATATGTGADWLGSQPVDWA
ncbi:TlyA family RNA methyltransferase [Citricoccus sp.]|uniref:TlyA family RNA methyltransferase n=1 Tax=Citricoccus sp. TaxID=1978372 RepID=UPI0028BDA4CE|nr:TlyA family RNA methyltransferase [Citricoccus sp.]